MIRPKAIARLIQMMLFSGLILSSCDKGGGKGDGKENPNGGPYNSPGGGCPGCGNNAIGIGIDLKSVQALALAGKAGGSLYLGEGTDDGADSLVKIKEDGTAESAIKLAIPDAADGAEINDYGRSVLQQLPRVAAVGVSPTKGDVFVLFERPFLYIQPPANYSGDTWDASSPYTCQLFQYSGKAKQGKASRSRLTKATNQI